LRSLRTRGRVGLATTTDQARQHDHQQAAGDAHPGKERWGCNAPQQRWQGHDGVTTARVTKEWRNSLSTIYDSAMSIHRNDTSGGR
jgi:hypothetical protein